MSLRALALSGGVPSAEVEAGEAISCSIDILQERFPSSWFRQSGVLSSRPGRLTQAIGRRPKKRFAEETRGCGQDGSA